MTLSGAAISAVQANKRAVPIKGRPRGRGRGMSRGASRGRRTSDSSGSYEQQKEFVSTPQDLRSPTNFEWVMGVVGCSVLPGPGTRQWVATLRDSASF